jgi:hypothetical protein
VLKAMMTATAILARDAIAADTFRRLMTQDVMSRKSFGGHPLHDGNDHIAAGAHKSIKQGADRCRLLLHVRHFPGAGFAAAPWPPLPECAAMTSFPRPGMKQRLEAPNLGSIDSVCLCFLLHLISGWLQAFCRRIPSLRGAAEVARDARQHVPSLLKIGPLTFPRRLLAKLPDSERVEKAEFTLGQDELCALTVSNQRWQRHEPLTPAQIGHHPCLSRHGSA